MVKTLIGGGSDLSPDMQKIYDKLVELLKGGKKLDISIDDLKKKAGVSNVSNKSVSAFITREKDKGTKFFNNITVKRFSGGLEAGLSKHDVTYNNNKTFRDFYKRNYNLPWEKLGTRENSYMKGNAYNSFLRNKKSFRQTEFTLTAEGVAKKLGITQSSLRTYEAKPDNNTSSRFIADNIKKIRSIDKGKSIALYKEPSETLLKNWKILQGSDQISSRMVNNIKEYDKVFRDEIKLNKKLPLISEVIDRTSMKTPSTIANTEALYSRLLRGENFKIDVGIARDVVLGKKIMDELSADQGFNTRRSAFYRLALDNVNKMYPGQSGNLETFKDNFRNELKKILGPQVKKVPFSVNEIISLSAGEVRGVQPFSVFVDAVETNINKGELSTYQSDFSKKLDKVQKLLSGKNPNTVEATRIAGLLKGTRKTLVDSLTQKGFTESQIKQLNLPEIVVSETIASKHYTPEKLARWKEQTKGTLDIEQFAKDKKFYIDIKKGKPFWESNVRNTIIEAAKNNIGNVCGIFKGKIAYSADGGRIGFQGGCAGEMTAAMETNPKGTLQQITKTEGILPKFQNAAKGFLGMLGRGGLKAAPLAALAAVGAGIEPLVKQFVADDPTTYLTNEGQMKGMLLATIEGETPKVDEEILKWQMPALGAATAAGAIPGARETYLDRLTGRGPAVGPAGTKALATIPEKPVGKVRAALGISGVLGKALGATFSPLAAAATLPISVAAQRKGGTEWGDIATDPMNWMTPAFASEGARLATKGMNPTGIMAQAIRLGMKPGTIKMISSKFGWPGLMIAGGMWGYDKWKNRSINDPED